MLVVQYGWDVDGRFDLINQDKDDEVSENSDRDDLHNDS